MKRLRKDRGSTGGLVGRIDENENSEIDNNSNSNSNNCESSSGDKESFPWSHHYHLPRQHFTRSEC